MAQTKEERLKAVHGRAMAEFNAIWSSMSDERKQCLQDRRFYSIAGAQWEGDLGAQFENKPKFEMNKVHLAVIRIFNEYRNNRITVNFAPKDGTKNDKLADTCASLYRADEQDSTAEEAYDNAFEEGVGGGFGAFRLRGEYEDDEDADDDRQRIRFEPIFDADTCVFFDLNAKRQDKSDAKRCFVLTSMTRDDYKAEYGDDPTTWPKPETSTGFDWASSDAVWIAEYYEVEQKSELFRFFQGLVVSDNGKPEEKKVSDAELKDNPDRLNELLATGFTEVRQKKVKRTKVHKYILSGGGVLEDCGFIAGRHIPIIPVYGKRWFVDNIERCMGHVRLARDATQLGNMLRSWLAEIAAMSKVEKPIFTPEQMAGHTTMWAEDNVKNYPYLLVNSITTPDGQTMPAGPIGYTKAPNIPPALAALLQITEQDLQDLLGNQQAGEEIQQNISGRAVELIQNRLDMQVFIYMSNMAKAIRRAGEVWLSMAQDLYIEDGRKMKSVSTSGDTGSVEIRRPAIDKDTGETVYENDLSNAKFDVSVDVGPSSASRRSATVRALTGMMQLTQDPDTLTVLTATSMMNMEGEGLSDVRDYFRQKLLRMGALKPTEEEAKQLEAEAQNRQPDPQAQYLKAAAQEAVAKAMKAQADTELNIAKAEQSRAETAKTLAEIGTEEQNQVIQAVKAVREASQPPEISY